MRDIAGNHAKMKSIVLGVLFLSLACCVSAQVQLSDFDSVVITKPEAAKLLYRVNHPDFWEFSIKQLKTIKEGNYQSASTQDDLMGIIGSGPRSNAVLPSMINTVPAGLDWHVDVYVKGTTNNRKLKTPEGLAAEVPELYQPYWETGFWGVIRNGKDTLATFGKLYEPQKDSLFREVYLATRSLHPPVDPIRKKYDYDRGLVYGNYGIFGDFKGSKWQIIFYERNRTAYIFIDDVLEGIYQLDYDVPNTKLISILSATPPRVPPVLLIRKGRNKSQQADLIRLAAFSMLVAQQRV
jgi:hypothetical protein